MHYSINNKQYINIYLNYCNMMLFLFGPAPHWPHVPPNQRDIERWNPEQALFSFPEISLISDRAQPV